MEQGAVVPQIDTNMTHNEPDAKVMALTGNTQTDLANIAAEMGVKLDASGNVATDQAQTQTQPAVVTPSPVPAQAVQPKPITTTEVPPKFQNEDGTVNVEKVEKSTKSVEEMLAYYRSKEREAQQLQNKVNNPAPVVPQTQQIPQQQFQPQNSQLSPLEYQMAQDLVNESAAQGFQLDQRLAIAQARVMARGLEAKHSAERSMTEDLRVEVEEGKRQRELEGLMQADPNLLTPEVADRLMAIRRENPAMRSYRDAYIHHLGEQEIAKRTGQVKTPIPTGQAARLPATPVGPVARVQSTVAIDNPNAMTTEQLEAEVRKAFPRYRGINR